MTAFIRASSDRKTRLYPTQQNTYGLSPGSIESGGSCVGATYGEGGCAHVKKGRKLGDCYVFQLQVIYKGIRGVLEHNTNFVFNTPKSVIQKMLEIEFKRFEVTEASRGNTTILNYRIHWSGDIPNIEYAEALRDAMLAVPNVKFWTYTRSFFAVPILAGISNLKLYISADEANKVEALKVYKENVSNKNISICWMGKVRTTDKEFPRLVACPVDSKKIEIEGGCHKCKLCLKGKPVFFEIK